MMGDGLPGLSPEDQLNDLADWWEVRHDDDVLFLFYDELLTEHRRCVARIAEFMELEPAADDALIDKVVARKDNFNTMMSVAQNSEHAAAYDFMPRTFIFPEEIEAFNAYHKS